MLGLLGSEVGTLFIVVFVGVLFRAVFRWNRAVFSDKPVTMEDYLYKISRVTGKSEYDVFIKSAEEWPVPVKRIEEDFKAYLQQQTVPYYVRDFVRKNKAHIDALHIPRF
jgi:hypothetical protein